MGLTVVAQAGTWLLATRDRIKTELGITVSTDDNILDAMIDRASSAIARETRRTFGIETVTETLDGSGSRLLGLTRTPIIEIIEVTEDSVALDASEYSVEDRAAGALYRANGWGRSPGLRMWGMEAYSSGYILPGYRDLRYAVTYRAGYVLPPEQNPYLETGPDDPTNLPGAVEQACLETVKAWYHARSSDPSRAVSSVQVGALRIGYTSSASSGSTSSSAGGLPSSALALLKPYYAGPLR